MTIRHDCKKSGVCFKEKHMPDWSLLDGCFPRDKIKVGDVDGAVEINGHVLWFEWKPLGKELSSGQRSMFIRATRDARKQVVLVIFGRKGTPERITKIERGASKTYPATIARLRDYVKRWSHHADADKGVAP